MSEPPRQSTTPFEEEEDEPRPSVDGLKHLQRWSAAYADGLAGLHSPDRATRLAAITALTTNISAEFVGAGLDVDRCGLFSRLFHLIRDPASPSEHNKALTFICIACLQRFEALEPIANAFVREFLPTLTSLSDDHAFRFYAVAVVASFGLVSDTDRNEVLARYCQLFTNRSARGSTFTARVLVECLKGLGVMLACYPLGVSLLHTGQLCNAIDAALVAKHAPILSAALDLLMLLHECQYRHADETLPAVLPEAQFTGNFIGKLDHVPTFVSKKAVQQSLAKHCGRARRAFAGEVESATITIACQTVPIVGIRRATFISAVRRLTEGEFGAQMAANVLIHRFLGISLMVQSSAVALKEKMKTVIHGSRTVEKRTREQEIAKKRRQKEKGEEAFDSMLA
jgi:hypothetical protein